LEVRALRTGAVGVAAVRAGGVLGAGVPALAVVRPGLGVNTFVEIVVEHQAVSAAELLRSCGELADDVLPAGGGVGEGGMGQRDSVRSNCFTVRTFEALDVRFRRVLLTFACEGGCLLFSDTGTLGLVEHKGRGAVVRVGEAVDAVVVLVANLRVLMVEESVGAIAARVQPGLRLLCNPSALLSQYSCCASDTSHLALYYVLLAQNLRTYSRAPQSTLNG